MSSIPVALCHLQTTTSFTPLHPWKVQNTTTATRAWTTVRVNNSTGHFTKTVPFNTTNWTILQSATPTSRTVDRCLIMGEGTAGTTCFISFQVTFKLNSKEFYWSNFYRRWRNYNSQFFYSRGRRGSYSSSDVAKGHIESKGHHQRSRSSSGRFRQRPMPDTSSNTSRSGH